MRIFSKALIKICLVANTFKALFFMAMLEFQIFQVAGG